MTIGYVSAQKTNITDAAVLMKKYNPMGGEKSVKLVNEAKGFIDKAAAHPETSESMKMHYYRGMIYFALVELESMKAMSGKTPDEDMVEKYSEKALTVGPASLLIQDLFQRMVGRMHMMRCQSVEMRRALSGWQRP